MSITIDETQWDNVKNQEYSNRVVFNDIVKYWSKTNYNKFEDVGRLVIKIKASLSRANRYSIHKLSLAGNFRTISYDDQYYERVLEITLSKEYMQDIFKDHIFNKIDESGHNEELEELSDRQILFNTLIEFVEKNFKNEFTDYLNKY
jgi:hypothetical protein